MLEQMNANLEKSIMPHTTSGITLIAILALILICAGSVAQAEEILLFDDFDEAPLDTGTWGLATWNIGDRTQFGNQPEFAAEGEDTFISLPLDTWNPAAPGQRVLGTEIYSLKNFNVDPAGIEYRVRARLGEQQGGLVAAFFTYNERRQKGRLLSDEIDFEVLSNWPGEVLVTSWDDWGAPGSDYDDGVHHRGAMLTPDLFDWQQWNTYAMVWYPDHVEWWINEVKVLEQAAPVPDLAQPARASLWAAGTTWPDAFNPSLAPVDDASLNRRFSWDIDYIMVTRLGGSGEPQTLAPPTDLAASVNGSEVSLSWTDTLNVGAAYKVYRAWKPKGAADPDFKQVATVPDGVMSYTESVQDGSHLYRVTAIDGAGHESAPSGILEVKVASGRKGRP